MFKNIKRTEKYFFIILYLIPLILLSCQRNECKFISQVDSNNNKTEGRFINNKKVGIWKTYLGSEYISLESYENGILNGPFIKYYLPDRVVESGFYSNGNLEGAYFKFGENNILAIRGQYHLGQRTGLWYEYWTNNELTLNLGMLNRILEYDQDKIIRVVKDYCLDPPTPGERPQCDSILQYLHSNNRSAGSAAMRR